METVKSAAAVDFAFDNLAELFERSRAVLGSSVVFPATLDWYKLVHLNEKGDFSQLAAVWTECHTPWTFGRMKRIKEEEEARRAGVAAAANTGATASSFSQRERSEYAMSTANTNYSGGVGERGGGAYGGGDHSALEVQKEQQEQLAKFLQAMAREHPIIRLCAEVVVGGTVTSFMAPMCSPLTKASCRFLTHGREGAGVEATDDERVALAKTLRRHGLWRGPSEGGQPLYRSSAAAHARGGLSSVGGALAAMMGGEGGDEEGAGGDADDAEEVVDEVDVSGGHGGPRKYWITEKSDGLRVVLCSQLAHNFPRWTARPLPALAANTNAAAGSEDNANNGSIALPTGTPSAWLHYLPLPPQHPGHGTPTGASLHDTVVLESARVSVSAVWARVVNKMVSVVLHHAQKTMCDDEERAKLLDNSAIGFAVLSAISTSLEEALGEGAAAAADDNPADASTVLPFEAPTIELVYNGVRNLPGVTSIEVGGGTFNTMLFAESDQVKFVTSGAFVLRIPIALGFFIRHLTAALKASYRERLEAKAAAAAAAAASADGSVAPAAPKAAPQRAQQLTPIFLLTAKTATGDGGSIVLRRQLGQRHFTYLFDRSMSQVFCLQDEYPFRVNTAILDAELIVAVPPVAPAEGNPQLAATGLSLPPAAPAAAATAVPTLAVLPIGHHDAAKLAALPPLPPATVAALPTHRKAFFAVFDLFAVGRETPHHPIYNNNHPTGRHVPFRLPIMRAHEVTLLNRTPMKERWDLLEAECLGPMNATANAVQQHINDQHRQRLLRLAAASAAATNDGAAAAAASAPTPSATAAPPQHLTLTMFRKEMWPLEALPACLALIRRTRIVTAVGQKRTYTTVVTDPTTGATEEKCEVSDELECEDHYLFRGKTLNDGLIFTPDDFDIVAGSRKHQLKWKWPDKLSVDWKVAPLPSKAIPLPTPREGELPTSPEFLRRVARVREIQSYEFFKVDMYFRRKKKPVDLAGDSEYRRSMRLLNPKRLYIPSHGCVAECSFDAESALWQIEKVRKDKFESNAVITIVSVMASACEGLDVNTLLAALGFLPAERAKMLIAQYLRLTAGAHNNNNNNGPSANEDVDDAEALSDADRQKSLLARRLGLGTSHNASAEEHEAAVLAADEEALSIKYADAEMARAAEVESKVLDEYTAFVARHSLGLVTVVDGADAPDEPVNEADLDEEERRALGLRKEMVALTAQLPMVHLLRAERAGIAEKERAAVEAYRKAVAEADAPAVAVPTSGGDIQFHAVEGDNANAAAVAAPVTAAPLARRPAGYTAPIPRCHMALSLSSRGGGGQAAKALFLQWHAKIAAQRNSIPCNHAMVRECYGLGEECPQLRGGSRLEGAIMIEMANGGGCYAWTDTVAEVVFDPLAGRWGIVSVDTSGNKNLCYGTQVISHLEAIASAHAQGKKFLVPKALRNLTARPPLGVAAPIDALDGDVAATGAAAASHDDATDGEAITGSAVNAAHYALRTVELRDNDETSRVRRFNNWVKAVLMASAAALVRADLHSNGGGNAEASTSAAAGGKMTAAAARAAAAAQDSSTLVANAANAPISVAELCCGRGGDLHKWRNQLGGGYLLMIDHCFEAVAEAARRYSVGKGLSTKVAPGKDGYPGVPAHFAVQSCFDEGILPIVEHCKATAPRPQLISAGFHIVSCQFSMHYAFRCEAQVRAFLANVAGSLRTGGLFIGTTCDATEILARKAKHGPTFGNPHYGISFDVTDAEVAAAATQQSENGGGKAAAAASVLTVGGCYGAPYRFSLESSVVSEMEYLVDWGRFTDLASRDYGLVCVESSNFRAFRDKQRRTAVGQQLWTEFLGDDALRRRGLKAGRPTTAAGEGADAEEAARLAGSSAPSDCVLSEDEDAAVSLYRTFIFQKVK